MFEKFLQKLFAGHEKRAGSNAYSNAPALDCAYLAKGRLPLWQQWVIYACKIPSQKNIRRESNPGVPGESADSLGWELARRRSLLIVTTGHVQSLLCTFAHKIYGRCVKLRM
jgi:hypothetical protein